MGWVLGEPAEPLNLPSSVSILGLTQIDFSSAITRGARSCAPTIFGVRA